jgi:L-ribulose-5-phosphate 3-epimerase
MPIRRRDLMESALGAAALTVLGRGGRELTAEEAVAKRARFRVAGCDWSLKKEGKLESFAVAKAAGLEGVEVSCGKGTDKLPISDPELQKRFLAEARQHGLAIPSTCLEILHRDSLKKHPNGPKWVAEAIEPTRALGAKTILLPSFGQNAPLGREEQEAFADRLKPVAPEAEKAGVFLGLENTLSAEDNARIIDRIGSPAVKVYYDVGNSCARYDVYKEIAWLGKDRIASIHLKDKTVRLAEGAIDFPKFLDAVLKSGYEGWLVLETKSGANVAEDFKANADYVRGILKAKGAL